jgi:hypothetical protein
MNVDAKNARTLALRVAERPFLDRSPEFTKRYDELRTALARIDARDLPEDRREAFNRTRGLIQHHGGRQHDHELKRLALAIDDLLRWHWGGLRLSSDVLRNLLRTALGQTSEAPELEEAELSYHQAHLFKYGYVVGTRSSSRGYTSAFSIDTVTEAGRKLLDEHGAAVDDGAAPSAMTIFISHSSEDSELLNALMDVVRAALIIEPTAIRASSANEGKLPGGAVVTDTLRNDVLRASGFLALLTPASTISTWVMFELGARWGSGKPLVPLLAKKLAPRHLKGPLANLSPLSCGQEAHVHQMLDELASMLKIEKRAPQMYLRQLQVLVRLSESS